jgi:hypothetical protein
VEFFFSSLVEWGLVCRRHKIIKVTWFKKVMENFHESFSCEKMLKKFIGKGFVWLFVFVFAIGLVCAAGDWGDINSDRDSNNESDNDTDINDTDVDVDPIVINDTNNDSDDDVTDVPYDYGYTAPDYSGGEADEKYTLNFYLALVFGVIFVLLVAYFAYLFLRKPRNKWKNKK